jgi:hypothetical protein
LESQALENIEVVDDFDALCGGLSFKITGYDLNLALRTVKTRLARLKDEKQSDLLSFI